MRRFILLLVAANVLGLGPLSFLDGEAHAQRQGSAARTKGKATTKKRPVKGGAKPEKTDDANVDTVDPLTGESATASAPPPTRGPTRLDFDDRLIQGQTNKSGAVYLYDRKELKTRSMIRERESFRSETIATVYE